MDIQQEIDTLNEAITEATTEAADLARRALGLKAARDRLVAIQATQKAAHERALAG